MKFIAALLLLTLAGTATLVQAKEKPVKHKDRERYREESRETPTGKTTTDTTVDVEQGTRFTLENFAGDITVHAWEKSAVRVQASHNTRTWVELQHEDGNLSVESGSRRGFPVTVDYVITVPTWMPLELSGVNSEIEVTGVKSDVKVETVSGNVMLTGGSGAIELSSVQGTVQVIGAHGKLEVSSVNDGVSLSGVSGELEVSAINGDIVMDKVESSSVDGSSMNGAIYYAGALKDGGHYHFDSNNGVIRVAIPAGTGVSASVSTYGGHFHATFPVTIATSDKSRRGKRRTFILNGGGAELEMESFQGRVELFRPGEVPLPKLEQHEDSGDGDSGDEDSGDSDGEKE